MESYGSKEADTAPAGDQRYGLCADRPHCQATVEVLSRTGQIGGPSGLRGAHEQLDCHGGGDGFSRSHLYLHNADGSTYGFRQILN